MKVLDLFCGLGGFSQAFRDRGHKVVGVDINPSVKPDIVADILTFDTDEYFDVVLASPPCQEFTKDFLPWRKGNPDLKLVFATLRVIDKVKPKYWVIENVIGAVKYFKPILGNYRLRCGSRYLWGNFPLFKVDHKKCFGKWRIPPSENRSLIRSKIPYEISFKLCVAIEQQNTLEVLV